MKQYIITTKDHNLLGIIPTKEMLKQFLDARDADNYFVNTIKDKQIITDMHNDSYCAISVHGHTLFPREFEYYLESFEEFLWNAEYLLGYFLKDYVPYLKLDKEETEIVTRMIGDAFFHHKNYQDKKTKLYNDDDIMANEAFHFRMKEFVEPALALYDN